MDFIIVTGLSGAGKTRAMHVLEDIGFYCVDNIPPQLIETFYDLCRKARGKKMKKVAIVTDIRGENFDLLLPVLDELKQSNKSYKVLFLEAKDNILSRRFVETRRKHPLLQLYAGSFVKAVQAERESLKKIREVADFIIDTSYLAPAQLKQRLSDIFLEDKWSAFNINCMSFGFKYGNPSEADLIFDVRCLPNPYYVEELRKLTGLDEFVNEYVMQKEETKGFVTRLFSLVDYMIPLYKNEGKSQIVIAIGCTGGKHRSVALTQLLYSHFLEIGQRATVQHRDIKKA